MEQYLKNKLTIIISAILLINCTNAKATQYYIDNSGNDSNNGISAKSAWQTIAKVNASTFLPGDKILFKKGGVWKERLNPPSSGNAGKVITFGSYGTGARPIITALETLSGFTNLGNIWTATANSGVSDLNVVLVNGSIKGKARYPNMGYLTFTSYSGNTQITGSLTAAQEYAGAEAVVRSSHWSLDVSKITAQSNGTLSLSPALSYTPNLGGNGYFIQNSPLALDTLGEWTFNATTKTFKVYATSNPTVRISTIDTLIYVYNKAYITFDGLSLQGANEAALQLRSINNIIIKNCSFNYSGRWAIAGVLASQLSILQDSIQNSLSDAICLVTSDFTKPGCDDVLIDNNYIKNSGTIAGMAAGRHLSYFGIYLTGEHPIITNNKIDSSGYTAIYFSGHNSLVKNNYITNFCFIKDDGGGIYTVIGRTFPADNNDGSIIRSNIVMNGIGASKGTSTSNIPSAGIYLDDNTRQITVDSNTIANCKMSGILFNGSNNITLRENTIINSVGSGLAIYGKNDIVTNLNIKKNIMFSQSPEQNNLLRWSGTSIGSIDSNYYSKSSKDTNHFNVSGVQYKFSDWNAKTGQDLHSLSIPVDVEASKPLFYYNPTKKDSTVLLKNTYADSKGRKYKNSITLHSFSSAILFKVL